MRRQPQGSAVGGGKGCGRWDLGRALGGWKACHASVECAKRSKTRACPGSYECAISSGMFLLDLHHQYKAMLFTLSALVYMVQHVPG
jgi:hypothetical protein